MSIESGREASVENADLERERERESANCTRQADDRAHVQIALRRRAVDGLDLLLGPLAAVRHLPRAGAGQVLQADPRPNSASKDGSDLENST